MDAPATFRRSALLLAVLALAAGCATPDENRGPVDLNRDGDRDGIPDGQSPVEGANEPDEGNVTGGQNTTGLPGAGPMPPTY